MPRALEASVKRCGVVAFRIACALAVLRAYERGERIDSIERLTTTDKDVAIGLTLTSIYLAHALAFGGSLPTTEPGKAPAQTAAWFDALPSEFSAAEAIAEGESRDVVARTVRRWIRLMLEAGSIERTLRGCYQKRQIVGMSAVSVLSALSASHLSQTDIADTPDKEDTRTIQQNGNSDGGEELRADIADTTDTPPLWEAPAEPMSLSLDDDPRAALGNWIEPIVDPWSGELPPGWTEGSL
jgi:hypothetical protein